MPSKTIGFIVERFRRAVALKNSQEGEKSAAETDSSNKYGITRGAAYWKKGGAGNAE